MDEVKFVEIGGQELCANCKLVGLNKKAFFVLRFGDSAPMPLCRECKEAYETFYLENGS